MLHIHKNDKVPENQEFCESQAYRIPNLFIDSYICGWGKFGTFVLSIYNYLARFADENGRSSASLKTISQCLNFSIPTVIKGLRVLEKNKLIRKINRRAEAKPNLYVLTSLKVEIIHYEGN